MPPRLFLHEFLKPREEIKELTQTSRVFQYVCSPSVYTWPFIPTIVAHPTFNSWWQEFHDHIFSEPVHLFCIELMPDFQPTSEVIRLILKSDISSSNHDPDVCFLYPQNTMPAPLAREIAYNAVGPISALGFRSPTLSQLMARYATTDPTLSSITADRRQGFSLIAPPTAKRRRTIKKALIEVKFSLS
jgi:hypothetical protein